MNGDAQENARTRQPRGIRAIWSGTPGSNRRPSPWQRGSPTFTIRQERPRIPTTLRFHSGLWIPIQGPVPRIFMRILKRHVPSVCPVGGREPIERRSTWRRYRRSLAARPRTSTTSASAPSCHTIETCRTRSGSTAGPSANRSGSVSKGPRRRVPATGEGIAETPDRVLANDRLRSARRRENRA